MSKALVPYYPLAGWLKESSQGQLQIDCSGTRCMVTQFECGGFCDWTHILPRYLGMDLVLRNSSTLFGENARGLEHPSTTPVWCRDFSPLPPPRKDEYSYQNYSAMPNYRAYSMPIIDIYLD
ncbi:hypothetical protein NC651_031060 [Populus alba x Populus x berolinensis]|nr:hypothetical protein NC651_031060 [Populus alba x Populus x berolinensis]